MDDDPARALAASRAFIFEYCSAADPDVPALPFAAFSSSLHASSDGPAGVFPLDLSASLFRAAGGADGVRAPPAGCAPCTSPNLLASFVRLRGGAPPVLASARATSHLFYVLRGAGSAARAGAAGGGEEPPLAWAAGDLFALPACDGVALALAPACADAALYWVCDAPLLGWLGAAPAAPRFSPTLWSAAALERELARVCADPAWRRRNRAGVLLGTAATSAPDAPLQTLTASHTMWALYNALPARHVQRPHKHNSVALDLCVRAGPNTYTLMAACVNDHGELQPPITRADWVAGSVFVTPPGLWHSHHNDSDVDAIVLPVQDAALHTFMRTLFIEFAPPDQRQPAPPV